MFAIRAKLAKRADDTSNANNRRYRNGMSPKKYRPNAYQVCIQILKARHLPQNANPMVVVKVGSRRKKTVVREKTDAPIYNEVISFQSVTEKKLSIVFTAPVFLNVTVFRV